MHLRVLLVQTADIFERFFPRGIVDSKGNGGLDGNQLRGFGKIIDGIRIDAELFERRLFFRERLPSRLVGIVGGKPDLTAESDGIVVQRKNRGFALSTHVEAVLFVITDSNDHAKNSIVKVLIFAERAESSFRAEVFDFVHPVLDEIGRLHLIHLQLRFRAIEFGEKRFEQAIASCSGMCGDHGRIRRRFRIVGGRAQRRSTQSKQRRQNRSQVSVKGFHGFTSGLACEPALEAVAVSSKPGGGKSGGRSC